MHSAASICGTTWLGETRLMFSQPVACSPSINRAMYSSDSAQRGVAFQMPAPASILA